MNIIKEHSDQFKKIGGALLIGTGIYLVYRYAFKSGDSNGSKKPLKIVFTKDDKYKESIKGLSLKIEPELMAHSLSKSSMNLIKKVAIGLIQDEYPKRVVNHRKERRKYLKKQITYLEVSVSHMNDLEWLYENACSEVVKDLNIDPAFFESEMKRHLNLDPSLESVSYFILESLKIKLVNKSKNIDKQQFIDYIKYQIDNYGKEPFPNTLKLDQETFYVIKQTYYQDLAAEKTGIEEEEFMARPDLLLDPLLKDLSDMLSKRHIDDQTREE